MFLEPPLAFLDSLSHSMPTTVALAAVALIGYIFGHRTRSEAQGEQLERARRELKRADRIARELEEIADTIRQGLARHHTSVSRFKRRLSELSSVSSEASWKELCREADQLLTPTLTLSSQLSYAYDQIRQQSNQLISFTETRTDPLTGVCNRRALEESLENLFAMMRRYDRLFSIAIFDIDHFKQVNDTHGHVNGDEILRDVARVLSEAVRETDIVARFGGEEFVVVMPQTDLAGAMTFAERIRRKVEVDLSVTISGGAALASQEDDSRTLLARADAALYGAKAAGRNRCFIHTGSNVKPGEFLQLAKVE